jgi:anthranilate/para-aminobenzoate synthase component II
VAAIRELRGRVPVLGVCLGHQAIAAALGGTIVRARVPVHGRTSPMHHDGINLFAGIPHHADRVAGLDASVTEQASVSPERSHDDDTRVVTF